jgi:hypothetical protein
MKIIYKCIIFNDCDYMRKLIASNNRTIFNARLTKKQIKDFMSKGNKVAIFNYGIVE